MKCIQIDANHYEYIHNTAQKRLINFQDQVLISNAFSRLKSIENQRENETE